MRTKWKEEIIIKHQKNIIKIKYIKVRRSVNANVAVNSIYFVENRPGNYNYI